jgi:ATP synthase protein I
MESNDKDLADLRERIDKFKPIYNVQKKVVSNQVNALNIGTELVAGVLVGLIIGVFFDKLFASKPLFIIICLTLGIIASGRTIWQKLKNSKNA